MKNILLKITLSFGLIFSGNLLYAKEATWPEKISFGVIPVAGSTSMTKMFSGLTSHLQASLGIKVKLQMAGDYTGVISAMQHKHIEFAYLGPKSYVEAAKRAGAEAIAAEVSNNMDTPGYYGLIISKKGSGLKTIDDLKNKRWAFTSSNSTSGTLLPMIYFLKMGIKPKEYFSKVLYSGGHEASILSLKAGRIDAVATNTLDFARGEGLHWKQEDFNIIRRSQMIPSSLIAVRSDIPATLKQAIKEALLSYKDKEGLAKMNIKRFESVDDSHYDTIRELIIMKKNWKK